MKWIVDRIAAGNAVCETEEREQLIIPLTEIVSEVHEGDVLVADSSGGKKVDKELTEQRKKKIQERFERMKKK